MPPRKRARHSRNTTATASPSPAPPSHTTPSKSSPVAAQFSDEDDLWTDAEETALFRALLRYKPTGLHKHQRMLALHSWLIENDLIHPEAEHTRIAGIWRKLGSMYDLAALDAREDARQLEKLNVPGSEEEGLVLEGEWSEVEGLVEVGEFGLPVGEDGDENIKEMVWRRRLRGSKDEGEESEVEMPEVNLRNTPPAVLDLRTGVEPSPQGKKSKGRARKGKEVKEVDVGRRGSLANVPSRRSARQAESTADETEAQSLDEKPDEEADGEDEEEEVEDSEDKESRASTPAARSTRSKGGAAAKGKAKGRTRAKAK